MRKPTVRDRSYGVAMTTDETTDETTENPFEPPTAGTEAEHLVGALNRLRSTFRWKADDLDAAGLQARIGRSELTIGGLLKHLALVEDHIHTSKLTGEPLGDLWDFDTWDSPQWPFTSAAGDSPQHLYALYDDAVERSRGRLAAAFERGGLDQPVHVSSPEGEHASLRRLLLDLIEEYGRHTGHADLLRESVDGRVGEDPPADWRPVSTTSWLGL
jgi:hypothetical protein